MNIFTYNDYRDAINDLLKNKLGRGAKVKLSETLNCNPGYISQVLGKSKIHFSAENIIKIASFLELNSEENEYLLNLLLFEKAGSSDLKNFYEKKIKQLQNENLKIVKKIKSTTGTLTDFAQSVYYSHWAYCAIHMVISITHFKKVDEIARRLNLNSKFVGKVLTFLENEQLITKEKNGYSIGNTRIHLKSDSPHIKSHHQNFRHRAILSLTEENEFDLHYSSVLTLSHKDACKIKNLILKLITDKEEILIPSPNEDIVCLNLDFFKL